MGHEISQFDIPDRQLLAINSQPKAGMWSDIGEAKIFRTMLGKAKVRVIREQDRKRRTRLIVLTVVMAASAAAWQGWIAYQQMQNEAPPLPLSERIRVSAPVFRPAIIPPAPPSSQRKSESLIQAEINSLVSGPLSRTPPPNLKAAAGMAVKPVKAEPLQASRPPPLAVIKSTKSNQTNLQQPGKLSATTQPVVPHAVLHADSHIVPAPLPAAAPASPIVAPTVAPAVATTKPSAATVPAAVQTSAAPLVKTDIPAPFPDKLSPDKAQLKAVNEQPEVNARGTAIIYVDPEANAKP